MKDVLTLAVFAAKVLCLMVFVSVLKPDGSIGAVWTSTKPADCTEAFGNAGMRPETFFSGFASRRQVMHCTSERRCNAEQQSADAAIVMTQTSPFWNRHAALVFSLKTFAAAMLAFSIALLLDMPRPYWAMASVYITANLFTGATYSKAVYRILGTLIGAAGTIVLVPNLVNAPELLSLAIALWVGICLYLSLIDGTPRSYVFMLAGYTVALLGFPIVSMPQSTFDIVVARVQEIMLGIICASVVAMVVLPRSVASAVTTQADAWLAARAGLAWMSSPAMAAIRIVTTNASDLRPRRPKSTSLGGISAMRSPLPRILRKGCSVCDNTCCRCFPCSDRSRTASSRSSSDGEASARVAAICARIARWLEEGGRNEQEADALRAALDEVRPALDRGCRLDRHHGRRSRHSAAQSCRRHARLPASARGDRRGRNPEQLPLAFRPDTLTMAVPHRDHGSALLAAASVALAVLACCAFPIATGWPDGVAAPLFAAVVGSLLAGVDDPLPTFRNFYGIFLIVIAVHGIYLFGVLPRITAFEMLIAALMPAFVLFGWMAARPATARVGSMLAIYSRCNWR